MSVPFFIGLDRYTEIRDDWSNASETERGEAALLEVFIEMMLPDEDQ